ncbi:MAG: hypothetical protein H0U97_02550 [Gammaproteobacteria bacterium]|nr:hypothetical protein [Gammaproteobacteria bacterium]
MFALCACLCRSAPAFEVFDGLQVHGFLSQGYFLTTNNSLFGSSERGGSLDFTELGVNASWMLRSDLQLAVQLLSRRAGEAAENEPELDFALLDYTALATADRRLGVRVGRVRLPFGLYGDTRDVAFTRPSILLPQSIYFDESRELAISGDGAMFYGEEHSPWGNFLLEVGPFSPRVDNDNSEVAILGVPQRGHLAGRLSFIGRLIYEAPIGGLRLAVTGARFESGYRPRPPDKFGPGDDLFEPLILSAQYDAEAWSLTGEYARRRVADENFAPGFDFDIVGDSYYVQGIYRWDPYLEIVVRYDALFFNEDDRDGTQFKVANPGIPAHTQFAKDWTAGVRYNITPSVMVRAEYHHVYGTAWLFQQDQVGFPNDPFSSTDKKWDLFALLVSYRF